MEQRGQFSRDSRGLLTWEKNSLEDFFDKDTLSTARIAKVFQIENPPFLSEWSSQGIPQFFDLRQSAGITFVDTIVVATKFKHTDKTWLSLLFHELIHVVQYRLLTPGEMIKRYITGWISKGFDYYHIPIEEQAYRLQRRFDTNTDPFSVEDTIRKELDYL